MLIILQLPSVLQRATVYGQVVSTPRKLSSSSISSQPFVPVKSAANNSAVAPKKVDDGTTPAAPLRRKVSAKSIKEPTPYDIPKSPGVSLQNIIFC